MDCNGTNVNGANQLTSSDIMSLNVNIASQPLNQSVPTGLNASLGAHSQSNSLNPGFVPQQPTFLPVVSASVNVPFHQNSSIPTLQKAPITLPPQPTNACENGRLMSYSSTAAYYKEYYVNVMNYLKNRIDAVESGNSSNSLQLHTAPPASIPVILESNHLVFFSNLLALYLLMLNLSTLNLSFRVDYLKTMIHGATRKPL